VILGPTAIGKSKLAVSNRGYEEIAERLNSIGADIKIIKN
jgi:UDP-N-acetylglucosamine enolpyruvyl transferase